jgi:kynurenine formamidase
MRIVDLSVPIVGTPPGVPGLMQNEIEYFSHADGAREVQEMYGVPARLLRDGEGWTRERITLGTHNSTHVDAPYHYNSTIQGEPARTIDELPLERFFGPGVVVDATDREDGEALDAADMEQRIAAAGHDLQPGDIVLVHTGRDAFYGEPDYIDRGPGATAAATHWLHDRGVRVMGVDAWGWDRPLRLQAADALASDEPGIFWQAHQADLDYCQLERLANLDALPPTGFTVACFPLRLHRASAAPARVVAFLDD